MPDRDTGRGRGLAAGLDSGVDLFAEASRARDGLTGLPNRTGFHSVLDRIFGDPSRSGVALLRISIDDLPTLRIDYGPTTSDGLVTAVAGRLKRSVRDGDLPAKLKEAEFGLLLAAEDVAEAACAAQRVLERLREPYEIAGQLVDVTVSIGIAFAAPDGSTAETLLGRAEIALERARASGRCEWRIFKPANAIDPDTQGAMLADLHRALDAGEMSLSFEPVVAIDGERLTHAGAVLRWCHPRIGLIESADFIPVLNDADVYRLLLAWTLRTACETNARTNQELRVVVSLLPSLAPDGGVVAAVEEALGATGLPPGRLMIGVSEAAIRNCDADCSAALAALRARGVGVVLDDFTSIGTDLGFLRTLKVDAIRTGASVLDELDNDLGAFVRMQALTGVAGSLGIPVIARGVRSEEDVDAFERYGFAGFEGPIFGGALTAAELTAFARNGSAPARRSGLPGD